MADTTDNLIKFRTGATQTTDTANNIARFNPDTQKIHYRGTDYGLSDEEKAKFALSADVPTEKQIQDLADAQISKANTSYTLTNYATTGALNTLKDEVSGKTTLEEVKSQGYITSADVPTKVSQLENDSKYITSSQTIISAVSATNADTLDGLHANGISALTNAGSKISNDLNWIDSSTTVAQANKTTGTLTIQKNGSAITTFNGSSVTANVTVPTKVSELNNDSNFITSGATVKNAQSADTLDGLHASGISALTNDTSKIGNGAGYITSSVTVAQANKTTGTLTIQKNGSAIATFNGSSVTANITTPTKVSELDNDSKFITSGATVASAQSATNADTLDNLHASGISALTNAGSKISNDLNWINSSATVAQANKVTNSLTIKSNGTTKGTYNGSSAVSVDITVPSSTSDLLNNSGFITSGATVASAINATNASSATNASNADTLDDYHASDISAMTNNTNKLANDAGFITTASTVAQANKVTNALTIQKNGTELGSFDGSTAKTINITVPTSASEITNNMGWITSASTVAQANKVTNSLTIQRNGTALGSYNGSASKTFNVTVPTKVSEISNDSKFITSASIPTSNTAFTNDAKYITSADIPTSNTAFSNDAKYITSGDTILSALNATNADTLDSYHASDISAMTNSTKKLTNDANFITTASTVQKAQATTGTLTVQKNGTNVGTFNGKTATINIAVPTSASEITNNMGWITSADTVVSAQSADTLDGYHASDISAMTNSTKKLTNDANFITTASTVQKAQATTGTLTIQKNGTTVKTFNGASVTANITTPTKVSELTNDSNFITSADTVASAQYATNADTLDNLHASDISALTNNTNKLTNGANFITSAVSSLANFYDKTAIDNMIKAGFSAVTASTLPASGDANKIYFISASTTGTSNIYDEYMYINSKWEHIGTTETELGNYYLKTATSSKTEIDTALATYLPLAGGTMTGQLNGTTITGSTLKGASISGTNITGGTITGATVKGANISGTTVKGATVSASIFKTSSTAVVSNLNADLLDGKNASDFATASHTHPYFPLSGEAQISGNVNFYGTPALTWNDATYRQRIAVTDDSTTGTKVFSFQQSSDSGTNWTDLCHIYDNGSVSATTFSGNVSGTAKYATSATTALNATNATNATSATNASNATNSSKLGGYTVAQVSAMTNNTSALTNGANFITSASTVQKAQATTGTLTIQKNGTNVATFNGASVTANVTVPTKVSELTNDSKYITSGATVLSAKSATNADTVDNLHASSISALTNAVSKMSDSGNYYTTAQTNTKLAGYLPLAGGTVSGATTFYQNSDSSYFTINRTTGVGSYIRYQNSGTTLGFIGISTDGVANLFKADGSTNYTLIHTGNSAHTHPSTQITGLGTMATQNTGSYSTATEVNTALAGKANSSHTHTSSQISDRITANAVTTLNWSTNSGNVPTMSLLAYWNGAYSSTSSNLAYCSKGAFGTMATKNASSYSSKTEVSNALAKKSDTGHTHYSITTEGDKRSTATLPSDYYNLIKFSGLKYSSAVTNPSTDTYQYVVGLGGWSDTSGGMPWEIAFDNTNIYARKATSASAWGSWSQFCYVGHTHTTGDVTGLGTMATQAKTSYSTATEVNKALTAKVSTSSLGTMAYKASGDYYTTASTSSNTQLTTAFNGKSDTSHNHNGTYAPISYTATVNTATGNIKTLSSNTGTLATNTGTLATNTGTLATNTGTLATNTANLSSNFSKYLPLSGGTMSGPINYESQIASGKQGHLVTSTALSIATSVTIMTESKAIGSYVGSLSSGGTWYNFINVRHRNGADDGNKYGMYIRNLMTSDGSLIWNHEGNGTWYGERTILDSNNYASTLSGIYAPKSITATVNTATGNIKTLSSATATLATNTGTLATNTGTLATNTATLSSNTATLSSTFSKYLPLSGGTMTGALNFKNATWNLVGDDAYIGDYDQSGMIGIKSKNNANYVGLGFVSSAGTSLGKIYYDNSKYLNIDSGLLNVGTSGTQYHITMGTASSYTWLDMRNSANTMVNSINWYPTYTQFSQPIKASVFSGNVSGTATNAIVAERPEGFSSKNASMTWGTLTTANGYTQRTCWVTTAGGAVGFADSGTQTFMQIDGFYYQNEGKYRVLDTNNYASTLSGVYAPKSYTATVNTATGNIKTLSSNTATLNSNFSKYLPLAGGSMSGRISGLSGATCDITNSNSYTLIGYDQTACTNCTAGTVVGSPEKQTYIRSSGDDLYHYNSAKTTAYKILDANNSAHTHSYVPLAGGNMTGVLKFSNNVGISGCIGNNDYWKITGGGSSDAGYAEIALGDNGNEPLYIRQYNTSNTVLHSITLMNADGNQVFNNVTATTLSATTVKGATVSGTNATFGSITGTLVGNASTATNCPNCVPMSGNASTSYISGSLWSNGQFVITGTSQGAGIVRYGEANGSAQFTVSNGTTTASTSSYIISYGGSHSASTISSASSGGTRTLMDAYSIQQYVKAQIEAAGTITITI